MDADQIVVQTGIPVPGCHFPDEIRRAVYQMRKGTELLAYLRIPQARRQTQAGLNGYN